MATVKQNSTSRVQITYEETTNSGRSNLKELPMVVAVLSNLRGHNTKKNFLPLTERKMLSIDDRNFFQMMAKINPTLELTVKNEITPESASKLDVHLEFVTLADFEPGQVMLQISSIVELLNMRNKINEFRKNYGDKTLFHKILNIVLQNAEKSEPLHFIPSSVNSESTNKSIENFVILYNKLWTKENFERAKTSLKVREEFYKQNQNEAKRLEFESQNWQKLSIVYDITGDKILNKNIPMEHHIGMQISTFVKNFPQTYKTENGFDKEKLLSIALNNWIASIDLEIIPRQMQHILHHPNFQELEAAWLGVRNVVYSKWHFSAEKRDLVKIKILDIAWDEIEKDISRAPEIDRSDLFKKIYSDEFDSPGGEPYSLIIGNYSVNNSPQHITTLRGMSQVAAASFAPFVVNANPSLFGVHYFHELTPLINFKEIFATQEYIAWNKFRQEPDTRFLGVLLPSHLMRLPYRQDTKLNGFPYAINEQVGFDGKSGNFLWGNCVFSFAAVAIKSFCKTGWYELMRGCNLDNPASGIVPDFIYFSEYKKHIQSELSTFEDFADGHFSTNLPNHYKENGENPVVMWFNLKTTESMEAQFAELGFIPLIPDMKFNCGVFYSCPSLHKHEEFKNASANANADISSSLHYIMCASRFAHYIKVIGRDKIGGLTSATIVENYLQKWLGRYIKGTERIQNAGAEFSSHAPLIDADVSVKESPLKIGVFSIEMSLQPRFQSQNVISTIKLFSEIKLRG